MNRHWIYCTVLVLGAFYINTLVLTVKLKVCSTRRRGVPTLGEVISTTTTTKAKSQLIFLGCARRLALRAFLRDIDSKIAGIPQCRTRHNTGIMDYPKFIGSDQKEESISIHRVYLTYA